MEFYHQFSESPKMGSYEVFTKPSMTEPDNTMTIPEIIARYTRGQGLGVQALPWQAGIAPEDGEAAPNDGTLQAVLEIPQLAAPAAPAPSSEPQPAAPAAAPAAAPSASPAPDPADPSAAPAGA